MIDDRRILTLMIDDMRIIAALKKRYKHLYLKDILDFYKLDENLKACKK